MILKFREIGNKFLLGNIGT